VFPRAPFLAAVADGFAYRRRGSAPRLRCHRTLFERHRKIADFSFSVAAEGREVRSPAGRYDPRSQ